MTRTIAPSHHRTTLRGDRGMSLVEASIILMTLATLTAVIAPTAGSYLEDARNTAAKEETEAIGTAILQLMNDVGTRCLRMEAHLDCSLTNRVDLLLSQGVDPAIDLTSAPDFVLPDATSALEPTVNWLPSASAPQNQDLLEDQLIENDNASPYASPTFTGGGGPRSKLGWRGAYLSGPITGDPWNRRYQVNTLFLTVATDTPASGTPYNEGLREAGWNRDVIVLSAGSNRLIQTPFGSEAVTGVGDDIIYVIKGGTR
jgi:type II secretory pathway pseudopilin PulG